MSNQVFKNENKRYLALKQNEYTLNGNVGILDNVPFNIQFDTLVKDEIGPSLVYSAGVMTATAPDALGMYIINFNTEWAAQPAKIGFREIYIQKNIEIIKRGSNRISPIGGTTSDINLSSITVVLDKVGDTLLTGGKIHEATGYMVINESYHCIAIMEKTKDNKIEFKQWEKYKETTSDQ